MSFCHLLIHNAYEQISNFSFKIPFIINALNTVKMSKEPDSSQNLTKVKVCIYLDALINFLSGIKKRNNMNREDFSFVTTKVETDIRSKFVHPHDQKLYEQMLYILSGLILIFVFVPVANRNTFYIKYQATSSSFRSSHPIQRMLTWTK